MSFTSASYCLIVFLFCLHFCVLSHFGIIRCILKSWIATSTHFLLKCNQKNKTWKVFFRLSNQCISLPNGLNMSLARQNYSQTSSLLTDTKWFPQSNVTWFLQSDIMWFLIVGRIFYRVPKNSIWQCQLKIYKFCSLSIFAFPFPLNTEGSKIFRS